MKQDPYRLVYGDIHNHNAHGYGTGSIERSVDIARSHLDFFAFTGHSSWHDLGEYGGRAAHFVEGFKRLKETWPRVQKVIADANSAPGFCAFLGFEWHSNHFGDQCVVFPEDFQPLFYTSQLAELRRFCVERSALMIPHHVAYPSGRRGANWHEFHEECTPVVEVYSWHGNSEDDRGPYPFLSGSPGGRQTSNTVQAALNRGLRFGFVGSSDNHSGFPGAYGEGLMGALVRDLTRAEILDAIRARRTYALTGDRIEVDFRVNGAILGSTIEAGRTLDVAYAVEGRDELDCVEVIMDGHVVHRQWPETAGTGDGADALRQVRFEWGWGPWGALGADRVTDWDFTVSLSAGEVVRAFPCLASGPFDEDRRHRIGVSGAREVSIRSYSSRNQAYAGNANQSVVIEFRAPADAVLKVERRAPGTAADEVPVAELVEQSRNMHVGPVPAESYQLHRIVPRSQSRLEGRVTLETPAKPSYVYLRVRQRNGHMAWVSPVFVNRG